MNSIRFIASNTLRQTVRQRLFYNVLLFGLALVTLAMVVSNITFGFPDRVVRSLGLSGVALAVDLMALLVGTTLVHQEIDRKTLFVLLTRPVERWQYVTGRYLGLVSAIVLMVVGLSLVYVIVLSSVRGTVTTADVVALGLIIPEAVLIGGIGVVLSCFTTPALGTGMGLGIWIIGATTDDVVKLTEGMEPAHTLAIGLSYVFPSLARFNFREQAVYQLSIASAEVLWAVTYGALYIIAVTALASLILSKREMV